MMWQFFDTVIMAQPIQSGYNDTSNFKYWKVLETAPGTLGRYEPIAEFIIIIILSLNKNTPFGNSLNRHSYKISLTHSVGTVNEKLKD